jgi:hypothetical protein
MPRETTKDRRAWQWWARYETADAAERRRMHEKAQAAWEKRLVARFWQLKRKQDRRMEKEPTAWMDARGMAVYPMQIHDVLGHVIPNVWWQRPHGSVGVLMPPARGRPRMPFDLDRFICHDEELLDAVEMGREIAFEVNTDD